jgi:hypothetical protein
MKHDGRPKTRTLARLPHTERREKTRPPKTVNTEHMRGGTVPQCQRKKEPAAVAN